MFERKFSHSQSDLLFILLYALKPLVNYSIDRGALLNQMEVLRKHP